jgi:very-short-patch-repair endonuclease
MTDAENRMWYYLRNRRLGGYKFVRELVIGHYIADFVCREKKLVIEIDGSQHMDAVEYDALRTKDLEGLGYRVLRLWNNEVFQNILGVMDSILNLLDTVPHQPPSSPTLLPPGRRERIAVID